MKNFFPKIKCGVLNDHYDLLGGGTVHSFKFLEYLKKYYDIDVYIPGNPKTKEWMKIFLNLDIDGLTFQRYSKGIGEKYKYIFLNISHWKAEKTNAFKKYMLVFFPQFFFPIPSDYEFLANSEYTKKNIIQRWKKDAKKIHVVYPPINTSKLKSIKKTNTIIHVSRITPPVSEADKGHRQMIKTFKKMCDEGLKDWWFYIVGQVQSPTYYNELKLLASGYPVRFFKNLPFKQLKKLYGEAKIYWHLTGITMPNEAGAQEHFGMTIVEAMASGAVPVCLNTGGVKEIFTNGVNGIFVKNITELKKATEGLIKDKKFLNQLSKKAIERAEYFNEENIKQKLYSVITKTDKVSIIILCHNNSKYTRECVERLYKVTPTGFELILIDNASTDNTKAVFQKLKKKFKNIKTIFNKKNLGFAKANNIGLAKTTKPYVCYLNNDTLPQWGWLERMVDVLETNPKAGAVGARLYFPKNPKREWIVQHAGVEIRNGEPKHIGGRIKDKLVKNLGIQEVGAVTGACMLVRKKLGKLNEKFTRGYYEDIDLCFRLREKGWKVFVNHDAKLIHYEGKTQILIQKKDRTKFKKISQVNKKLFHKLWDKKMKKLPKMSKMINVLKIGSVKDVEIGGGEHPLYPKYIQVDLRKLKGVKYQNDARLLPFASNSLSNICSCYMLQCLSKEEAEKALREWFRCLKPGGKLEIHVPDLDKIMRMFISTQDEKLLNKIYGNQEYELDYYQHGWTFRTLDKILSKINFVRVSFTKQPKHRKFALSVIAYKPK